MKDVRKLDANEQLWFERELTVVQSQTYDIIYPELKARTLIPVSFELGNAAVAGKYDQYSETGEAKVINNFAKDFNRVDIKRKEFIYPVKPLGDCYGYNVKEIRAARKSGMSLEVRRANSAKNAIARAENKIAWFGDADYGIDGFITNPHVPTSTVLAGGGGSLLWSAKTAEEILTDLTTAFNKPAVNTEDVETGTNTLLLPPEFYRLIKSRKMSSVSETTILQWFLNNNEGVQVASLRELGAAVNPLGKDLILAYERNPMKLQLQIASDFEQFPPQEEALEYVVYCMENIAGTKLYYPMSAALTDGFGA